MGRLDAIDTGALLDDFAGEARAHIEKIESAFLDLDALAGNPALMDGVFRAAHSLKGTAGFFSLGKIVAVAHELESVFTRVKKGELAPDDEIADVVLRSADCLKELVDHLQTPDAVEADGLLALLREYSEAQTREESAVEARVPFDLGEPAAEKILESAEKHGHRAYYLDIRPGGSLGRYDGHPEGLVEDITSIGAIVKAAADGAEIEAAPSGLAAQVAGVLRAGHVERLDLLVTSVLEPELFLIAVELEGRFVHPIQRASASGRESGEGDRKPAPPAAAALPAQRGGFSIQLDVAIINGLMDLTNEMILTRNKLISSLSSHRKSLIALTPVIHDMNRLTSEIRERVMRARMQPISVLFKKFPRMIHDTAKSLGKEIQIEFSGGDVALDKYLLDSISDPITQLVKNAADHGIESARQRAAACKPPKGSITLSARTGEGWAIIEVSDDGAGMDPALLRRKALERGLASEERLASMTDPASFALIFEPGFSTAEQVTNLSGRGVGMDIVKTNIEKLGGSVGVESELGRGTTMRLSVPLTLSVTRALAVTIDAVQYAIPGASVERIVRASASSSKRFERLGSSLSLNLDGWVIPAVTLAEIDARAKGAEPPADAFPEERLRAGVAKCLVLRAGGGYCALLIDAATRTEETLIRPLPIYLRGCACYAGTAVLGSGKTVMILDAAGIMRSMGIAGAKKETAPDAQPARDMRRGIVFQCSGAEYFALDMERVSRIERIDRGLIRETDDGPFVDAGGKSVRVLRPEDYAPVQTRGCEREKLCLLMLAGTDAPPAGLLADRVLDQIEEAAAQGGQPESRYIIGRSAYREKPLIYLNSAEIVRSLKNNNTDLGAPSQTPQGGYAPLTPV